MSLAKMKDEISCVCLIKSRNNYAAEQLFLFAPNKVPLFKGTEIGFLKMLCMKVKPVYFLAKEYVVRKGDIGHEVRIVRYIAIHQICAQDLFSMGGLYCCFISDHVILLKILTL